MKKQFISPKGVYEWPTYSQAVKVNNTIYVSGQAGVDEQGKMESGFEAQAFSFSFLPPVYFTACRFTQLPDLSIESSSGS